MLLKIVDNRLCIEYNRLCVTFWENNQLSGVCVCKYQLNQLCLISN